MRIAIRVDASSQIGSGHLMRCLTLADAVTRRGAQVSLLCRCLPDHLKKVVLAKGHELIPLTGNSVKESLDKLPHAGWLTTSQEADAQECLKAVDGSELDWVIVDHYALDARWESVLRTSTRNILAIDDLADRRHACDILLDQNYCADSELRYDGKVPQYCRLLLGPRYALLREEFCQLRERARARAAEVGRVLVFFGGADKKNFTAHAIEALAALRKDLCVDVVIGGDHPATKQIQSACISHHFECHVQTARMAELMAAADLAIGAGGATTWERCCLGLPTFAICTANNQVRQVADAAADGLLYAPEIVGDLTEWMARHLSALIENSPLRQAMSRKGMQRVDGRGVSRVVSELGYSGVEIRPVTTNDSKRLFGWRNHETIRAVSRNSDVITWDDHQKWFSAVMGDAKRCLLIGERDGLPLGVVRFDIKGRTAEVSVYVVPGTAGSGRGRDLLQAAERWLVAGRPEVTTLHAHVLGGNDRSESLFVGSGYDVDSSTYSKSLPQ